MVRQIKKFQIGKNGLTDSFIEQLKNFFEKSDDEIVKIDILKSACRDKNQAKEIADKLVDGLGKNFTYRIVGYVLSVRKFRKDVR